MIRTVATLATVAADALLLSVVAAWAGAAYTDDQHVVNGFLFVATAFAAYGVVWLGDELDLRPPKGPIFVAVAAFVVLYGSLRITFGGDFALWDFGWVGDFMTRAQATLRDGSDVIPGTILLVAAWVRGAMRANEEVELELVPRAVGVPFVIVTGILVLGAPTDSAGEIARAGAAFYAVAVTALACSQLAMSGATFGDLRAGGITATLLGGTVVVTLGCVVVFGIVFGFLASALGPALGKGIEWVLLVVLTPPAWVLQHLFALLLSGWDPPEGLENIRGEIGNVAERDQENDPSRATLIGVFFLRILALLIVAAVVAGVIAWYSRLRRRVKTNPEEGVVSAVAGGIGEDAASLLRRLFRRGGDRPAPARGATEAERLYHTVLQRAQHAGEVREPGVTPEEFAPRLRETLHTPVTDDITQAFEESRYAGRPPDAVRVAELERRWRDSAG